jgi:hypothetical protein
VKRQVRAAQREGCGGGPFRMVQLWVNLAAKDPVMRGTTA